MMINFKHKIGQDIIENDLSVMKKSGLIFKDLHHKIALGNFLEAFGHSSISIIDNVSQYNSLFLEEPILSFCYNFYGGMSRLKENNNFIAHTFGLESQSYFLKYYIVKEDLIIEKDGKILSYNFDTFYNEFKTFYKKILSQLPTFYSEIETCKYFQECIYQSKK